MHSRLSLLPALLLLSACATAHPALLRQADLFYVGGEVAGDPPQHVGQALVHRFVGVVDGGAPIVLYPGLGLSAVIWMSTPDGREGWAQHMARAGHPTYAYDPVNSGPSGFPVAERPTRLNQEVLRVRRHDGAHAIEGN